MRDSEIIELYFARDEQAIAETDKAYGTYCQSIAMQILGNPSDSEECVNVHFTAKAALSAERIRRISSSLPVRRLRGSPDLFRRSAQRSRILPLLRP